MPTSKSSIRMAILAALLAFLLLVASHSVDARHRRHQKKASDYETASDYESGVFIDAVPVRTTTPSPSSSSREASSLSSYKKTNRYPLLRRFFLEGERMVEK